jgi:phenylacetate-coenzyme A ligase PaaK-like adenylate-forming protein
MNIAQILDIQPYSLKKTEKEKLLSPCLTQLSQHHYTSCRPYRKMMDSIGYDPSKEYNYHDLPFIPARLFSMLDMCSVPEEEVVKTMTSSGTTGQAVSKIFLDKDTSANQTKALTRIVSSFIGTRRLPMIIMDTESVVSDRNHFSARAAGVLGFSIFGTRRLFALNDEMELNEEQLIAFVKQHRDEQIIMFGFTSVIYQNFIKKLFERNNFPDLSNVVLIHGGGWKNVTADSISADDFKRKPSEICGIRTVYEYYGLIEQTGSIYMSCEYGYFHAPVYSDVITRRAIDFSIAKKGEKGIIQVVSILPGSYPGHSLLTEDEGMLMGEDDCKCERLGKYFKITGRLKNAEIRGCGNTYHE